ncbi:MAG: hypothetical protein IH984_06175 [Planctomycetes bacterium]|nr:hypothetical protein [Planctomycetota bacterium]
MSQSDSQSRNSQHEWNGSKPPSSSAEEKIEIEPSESKAIYLKFDSLIRKRATGSVHFDLLQKRPAGRGEGTYEKVAQKIEQQVRQTERLMIVVDGVLDTRIYGGVDFLSTLENRCCAGMRFVLVTGHFVKRSQIQAIRKLIPALVALPRVDVYVTTHGMPWLDFAVSDTTVAIVQGPNLHGPLERAVYEATSKESEVTRLILAYSRMREDLASVRSSDDYQIAADDELAEMLRSAYPDALSGEEQPAGWLTTALEVIAECNNEYYEPFRYKGPDAARAKTSMSEQRVAISMLEVARRGLQGNR